MTPNQTSCSDCTADRREFLRSVGAAAIATAAGASTLGRVHASPTPTSPAETAVKALYDSLTEKQRAKVCFDWDHMDPKRGLLRTFVSNNWQITPDKITSGFYTKKQQDILHDAFKGLINPEWYSKFMKQLKDDSGGKPWGAEQSIAIFGKPGDAKFELVLTGRHQTLRADGNTEAHVAFGGPIFYGHAAENFNEKPNHPGNVFWPQAVEANKVFAMLEEPQRKKALVAQTPKEDAVAFRGPKGQFPGIPVTDLGPDQKTQLQKTLATLVEPFREVDRDEAMACLKAQGGLDRCSLAFYQDQDLGNDKIWDNWRLEGPSFVWYFRGNPHVHVWVNIADSHEVKLNARG
jgi:hypothetical protein